MSYFKLIHNRKYNLKSNASIYLALLLGFIVSHSSSFAKNQKSLSPVYDTKLHIVNIGKGQSLILGHGCSVSLIDAGGEMSNYEHYISKLQTIMKSRSTSSLNTIIVSHSHNDHLRYLKSFKEIPINTKVLIGNSTLLKKKPYLKNLLNSSLDSEIIARSVNTDTFKPAEHTIRSSDSCSSTDLKIDLLWGSLSKDDKERSDYYKRHEENNNSVVVGLRNTPVPILILGDANKPTQSLLLKYGKDQLKKYKGAALVVGHHGYNNGVNKKFLKYLKPSSLFISRTSNHPLRKKTYKVLIEAANLQPATRSHLINVECKSDNPSIKSLWGNLDSGIHDHGPGCPAITNRKLFMTSDQGDILLHFSKKGKLQIDTQY